MSDLVHEIESTEARSPTLWWLGHSGFAVKYEGIVFYVDPCLSTRRAHRSPRSHEIARMRT